MQALLNHPYTVGVGIGVLFGFLSRLVMLQTDYRQYPTYPHGRIIHLSLGVIAAGLGALVVPSILEKQYTAVTFLSLAAQQFRDVRSMERETLTKLDTKELVPRGVSYIEGIAMVFEGRNYLSILTACLTTMFCVLFAWYWGALVGIIAVLVSWHFKSGKSLGGIADIRPAEVRMEGADLYVGDIYIMNIGLQSSRDIIRERGLGLVATPKNANCRATLANPGQRQAMLHDMSVILGIYRDEGEPSLTPLAKLDLKDGRLGVFLLPLNQDPDFACQVFRRVPLLENAVKLPSEAPGR
ncbi:hypothetical protein J31TS4_07700 [Paenibacillus sp. J31TS4]|uniref:YIEGIA family protein n=1 Tax=Paenibacillus sp. J31TS4 TaxID=2807195 RepID=UPI001B1CEA75|nr:YIEGIA family protein [Paenibacillus sp. J31TS4]GIP37490.1 hypothetical protein J31TS4_07700 [Paenibacillus sp. J31TS4]